MGLTVSLWVEGGTKTQTNTHILCMCTSRQVNSLKDLLKESPHLCGGFLLMNTEKRCGEKMAGGVLGK